MPAAPPSRAGPRRSRRRRPSRLLALGAAAAAWAAAGPLAAQNGEVRAVRFEGNETFSDRVLGSAILTRATECRSIVLAPFCWAGAEFARDARFLREREFQRDVARIKVFYYQRGYREAQVDAAAVLDDEGRVAVTFRIQEGRPVLLRELEITGVEQVEDPQVAEELPLAVGGPLNGLQLDAARDTLVARLRNRGYAHAEVLRSFFIPRSTPYEASVTLDVYPGPLSRFGPVTVVGNEEVSEIVVRRMLPLREGDLFRQDRIFDGQRNLYNLEIFRHAAITADLEHEPDSIVPLTVQVNEGDVHRVRTGAGWTTADCFNAEGRWVSRNFRGGARRLQARVRFSNLLVPEFERTLCRESGTGPFGQVNWLTSLDFTQPWLFSPRNSFSASLFAERQSLKDVFVRRAVGASLALSRTIGRGSTLTFSYRPQLARLDAAELFFCSSFLVCEPDDIGLLQGTNRLSPLGVAVSRDRTNDLLNPTRGYSALLDLEHASDWTGSQFKHERVLGEAAWYAQPVAGTVFAARIRSGWVNPRVFGGLSPGAEGAKVVHPQKRFYAGGSNSVRGYAQNQLGPRVLTVGVERLLGPDPDDGPPACTPQEIVDLSCDANALPDGAFVPLPNGGTTLLEGNLEVRFPFLVPLAQAALFMDFGQVWGDGQAVRPFAVEVTPGFGVRYFTPIGPLRVDVGYRFAAAERLQVVTSQIRPLAEDDDRGRSIEGADDWVRSDRLALLEPRVLFGGDEPWWSRVQLHFSIGQAF